MLVLGLNTAFSAMEACLVKDGEILVDQRKPMARGQDKELSSFIEEMLIEEGFTFDQLDRIGVVTGPGSFTGIRIGVSYARGLALVTGASCIGVTSLEAAIPKGFEGAALACLPAQKRPPDQTWWVQGINSDAGIAEVVELKLEELLPMLEGFHAPVFMGESDALGERAEKLDIRPMQPSAITAALKAATFKAADHLPAPVYARAPDAALPTPKA